MRKSHRDVLVVAAAVAMASPALAGGKGSAPSSTPPGFTSPGGHNGFETYTGSSTTNGTTTSSTNLPRGWDEGNAAWKQNPSPTTRPPGLKSH